MQFHAFICSVGHCGLIQFIIYIGSRRLFSIFLGLGNQAWKRIGCSFLSPTLFPSRSLLPHETQYWLARKKTNICQNKKITATKVWVVPQAMPPSSAVCNASLDLKRQTSSSEFHFHYRFCSPNIKRKKPITLSKFSTKWLLWNATRLVISCQSATSSSRISNILSSSPSNTLSRCAGHKDLLLLLLLLLLLRFGPQGQDLGLQARI